MKIALVYNSLTGNTKKLAEGVFENIPEKYTKNIFEIDDDFDIELYDIVIPTFWVDRSAPNAKMKDFILKLRNTKVFLLATMGFFPDSEHGRDCIENSLKLLDSSCELIGYFICNGKVNTKLLEKMGKMKTNSPSEEAFKAHMLDSKNLIKYRILGEHTNDLDVEYASARVNERLFIEEEISLL
ncbi:flavodoxin family protein [Peptostreptococcus russellii]|uniref:flavodoxin family protein n=1 Tax=Peptostreptococcus russellii TaxID=215200 RepID=UPI0026E9A82F|nr:flavodoxin family protein [Peptostreptococcus russellii]